MRYKKIKIIVLCSLMCMVLMSSLSIVTFASDQTSEISFGKNFTFNPSSADLFSNFKGLMPGESRTQDIKIKNTSTDSTSFYLRIAAADQDKTLTESQKDLVYDLIYNKITVNITDINGKIIYEGGIGGKNALKTPDTVTAGTFFMGKVSTGSESSIKVNLTMDSSVGNEYQGFAGKVKWILIAEQNGDVTTMNINDNQTPLAGLFGDGSSSKNSSSVKNVSGTKTGDKSQIVMWSVIAITAVGALVFVIVKKRQLNISDKK